LVSKDPLAEVVKLTIDNKSYFLKRYATSKRKLKRYLGRSRLRTEWKNYMFFHSLGIPIPKIVAHGRETRGWINYRGILITEELADTADLASIAEQHPSLLHQQRWLAHVLIQLARITRLMHQNRFAHNDLKWRNILVDMESPLPNIYLIDCPTGRKWIWPFLEYRKTKDLICLDIRARRHLSRTQRLRFYKEYAQCQKLTDKDKKRIRKIEKYFQRRG